MAFVRRKYADGGLVRIKYGGEWRGVTLNATDHSIRATPVDREEDIEKKVVYDLQWGGLEVDSVILPRQYVWHQGSPMVAYHNAIQTTQRSIRSQDVILCRPVLNWLTKQNYIKQGEINIRQPMPVPGVSVWKQILNPYSRELKKAITFLGMKNNLECMINKKFMVSRPLNESGAYWLWHLMHPIGTIKGTVINARTEFAVEIEDFLRETGQQDAWRVHELE